MSAVALKKQFNPQQTFEIPTQPRQSQEPSQCLTSTGVHGRRSPKVGWTSPVTGGTLPTSLDGNIRLIKTDPADVSDAAQTEVKAFEKVDVNVDIQSYSTFSVTQKWEGYVVSVDQATLTAIITDLTNSYNPREEIIISIDEISYEDRQLIVPGAVFYWHVGYLDDSNGQRTRGSSFRFRRMPAWSRSELLAATREADELLKLFSEE